MGDLLREMDMIDDKEKFQDLLTFVFNENKTEEVCQLLSTIFL